MIAILVICHEPMATALIHCTRHVFGRMPPQLAAIDVLPDEDPVQVEQAARELLARVNDGSGVIVLTDLFGATPSRIARNLFAPYRSLVVAGASLPMLIKALTERRHVEELEELVVAITEAGRSGVVVVQPPERPTPQESPKVPSKDK